MHILVQIVIILERKHTLKRNLQNIRTEASSLSTVNLEKKIYYGSRDIEFFLGSYFFMARHVQLLRSIHCNFCLNLHIIHGDMKENVSGCFLNSVFMTNRKLHMRFRLTPRSMTLDDLELNKFEFSDNFVGISQISDATTGKRMKIDQHC